MGTKKDSVVNQAQLVRIVKPLITHQSALLDGNGKPRAGIEGHPQISLAYTNVCNGLDPLVAGTDDTRYPRFDTTLVIRVGMITDDTGDDMHSEHFVTHLAEQLDAYPKVATARTKLEEAERMVKEADRVRSEYFANDPEHASINTAINGKKEENRAIREGAKANKRGMSQTLRELVDKDRKSVV